MTPIDVRRYLRSQGPSSRDDIVRAFNADPGVVDAAIDVWQRKGRISRRESGPACAACTSCGAEPATTVYAWVEEGEEPACGSEDR